MTHIELLERNISSDTDCQKLYTSKISCSILERNHEEFKASISQSPIKSENDLVRRHVAKGHLEKIALDTMVGQAAERRGYLYTEIKAELNAAKVVANGVIDHICKMEDFEGLDIKPEIFTPKFLPQNFYPQIFTPKFLCPKILSSE